MKLTTYWLLVVCLLVVAHPRQCFAQKAVDPAIPNLKITRSGSQPTRPGPAEYFTGNVRIDSNFQADEPGRVGGASVTFEPGARTNWHVHPLGQTLIVTAGTGLVQQDGGPVEEIKQGDIVWIPSGVKHWHGASPTSAMTHLAIAEKQGGTSVTWMEKVTDAQYSARQTASQNAPNMNKEPTKEPSRAQQLMGDFAPKLAELTDTVLFGDVWARPELSPRDRSLVTVAALISGGNTEQLRSHLQLAKTNGVTETELSEVMTHLAFYCGWPKAISAIGVAKEVFKK